MVDSAMQPPPIPVPRRDPLGRWDLREAKACQRRLRERVECQDRLGPVRCVAGADVSYLQGEAKLYAAVVLLDAATLEPLETATTVAPTRFPYLPGYLSFRESPAILEAYSKLDRKPDLLMVDGHGLAHPRGFGIACHLGVVLRVPTVGVAKSVLTGEAGVPSRERGSRAPIIYQGARVGAVVRTRNGVSPVYVSIGHRVCLETAVQQVLRCGAGYRLPEPTRQAHQAVNALRTGRKTL